MLAPSPSQQSEPLPYGLVSLGEMINFRFGYFHGAIERARLLADIHGNAPPMEMIDDSSIRLIDLAVDDIAEFARTMGLKATQARAESITLSTKYRDIKPLTNQWACGQLTTLHEILISDAFDHVFYHYPLNRSAIVRGVKDDWKNALAAFGSAKEDIEAGVDCYALGHNTAAVFHMMRVAEIGLRALARERRVELPKKKPITHAQWGEIVKEIDKEAEHIVQKAPAGDGKDAAMAFYSGAAGHIRALKDKYRNRVMHARERFNEYEAADAMFHTRSFMNSISERLNEETKSQIKWKY